MDEYTFSLQERFDKNQERYLFGSLRMVNCVLFVFPSDTGVPGEYKAVLRPFTRDGKQEFAWNDSTLETTTKPLNQGQRK